MFFFFNFSSKSDIPLVNLSDYNGYNKKRKNSSDNSDGMLPSMNGYY